MAIYAFLYRLLNWGSDFSILLLLEVLLVIDGALSLAHDFASVHRKYGKL